MSAAASGCRPSACSWSRRPRATTTWRPGWRGCRRSATGATRWMSGWTSRPRWTASPTDVVAALLRLRHARSAAQLLRRLRAAGLAGYETVRPGPLVESRGLRLWSLTPAGRAMVAAGGLAPADEARDRLPYGR